MYLGFDPFCVHFFCSQILHDSSKHTEEICTKSFHQNVKKKIAAQVSGLAARCKCPQRFTLPVEWSV